MILAFVIAFATLLLVVAVTHKVVSHRFRGKVEDLKFKLKSCEKDKKRLREEIAGLSMRGGIDESCVLAIAKEIARMENNLYRMDDVPGRKQVSKALERMKLVLQAADYTIVPLLGTSYREGMQVSVVFVPDESLPMGSSVITSVQKPQVNRAGRMIQAASVTVGQNTFAI